jgi:F-type H+-transporting ATPase subunit a
MVKNQIGSNHEIYLPFIYSLFFFVVISNLTGNITYNFTITTSVITTLGLSFAIFFGFTLLSVSIHKFRFFATFLPEGTPVVLIPLLVLIEFVSYSSRAISLGVRLFANMVAGHTLMAILSSFLLQMFSASILMFFLTLIPFAIFLAIVGLELAVSVIQGYVLVLLVCSYIKGAIYLH